MTTKRSLYDLVISEIPELADNINEFHFATGSIMLVSDETGEYIAKWNYSKPLTDALKSYYRA